MILAPRHRRLLRGAGVAAAVLAILLGLACLVYPPTYVYRLLAFREADSDDFQHFPLRRIAPRQDATPLVRNPQRGAVEAAWKVAGGELPMRHGLENLGTQAFLVLRRGEVVYEDYYDGLTRESWVTSFSIAKSFLSALVGIAVQEGAIGSLNDPVTKYLPELRQRDPRFERIRLRHLLRMASGLRYRQFPFLHGDDFKTYYHPDLRALALQDTVIAGEPGRVYQYNAYNVVLLGMVLERVTQMPVSRYLETRLWQPAGMVGEASWTLDSEKGGLERMESGLNARPEDFARFGQLMLDQGRAGERQVVPPDWVDASTSADEVALSPRYYAGSTWITRSPRRYYAAMWWGESRVDGTRDFAARGDLGQLLFVSPHNGVVIVRHGSHDGLDPGAWFERLRLMADALGEKPASNKTQ